VVLTSLPILLLASISAGRSSVVTLHRTLLASVHDQIALLDGNGTIIEVNDAWRRATEATASVFRNALLGVHYPSLLRIAAEQGNKAAGRFVTELEIAVSKGGHRFELEYDSPDGQRIAVSADSLSRPGLGAIVRRIDVTARHLEQMEMAEQRQQLSHLARVSALGQLSGALAHELNQPLASISSNAEAAILLLRHREDRLLDIEEILRDIVSEDRRAAEVIRRMRAMLKRGEMRLQPLNTGELIHDVLELAHAELITRSVRATAYVPPDHAPVVGDRIQLQQVLLNLILNACEAMRSTPVSNRRITMIVRAAAGGATQISVADTGPGIPPALTDRLFEPFLTTKPEGLGLGLSISRTIIASHGGRLWAENNEGGGATIHCLLPGVACAPASGARIAPAALATSA
jgi:C4-dicarboxylate-specific signal transduction histidine kinase